jgi:hypothetical protein
MDFRIQPVKHTGNYSLKKPSMKNGKAIFPMVTAMIIIAGCSAQAKEDYPPLPGKPAYNPVIYDKAQMNHVISNYFANYLDISFTMDKNLKLKNKAGSVEFTADGYNEKYKIAYEWVDKPEYKNDTNQKSALSDNEIALIKNCKFDSTYILIIYGTKHNDITGGFWSFYEMYTNSMKQKGQ